MQSWKLSYSREKARISVWNSHCIYIYRQKYSNIEAGGKIRKEIWKTMANLCALNAFLLSRKNRYSPTIREKCRFHCSLDQITPFPDKFTFFMYSLNQYTYYVSRICAPTAWIFNKLSKSKQEPVRVQWGYCWRGVRVIEKPLYDYWPDWRFINLIVMPLLLSTLAEFPFLFAD